jgi:hypothetical protein
MKKLFLSLVFLIAFLCTQAQHGLLLVGTGSAPSAPAFLDTYPGAGLACSVQLLSSTYTGPLVRIRRAADGAEKDFYPNSAGVLAVDSQAPDNETLQSFCTSVINVKYVKIWYDQSGNGNHLNAISNFSAPTIADFNGNFHFVNGRLSFLFSGSNDGLISSYNPTQDNYTVISVQTSVANGNGVYLSMSTGSSQIYMLTSHQPPQTVFFGMVV